MQDPEIVALLECRQDAVAAVRRWIRGALTPFRNALHRELEDLEQEVLEALLEGIREGSYRGDRGLAPYVRSLAHNRCVDRIRYHARRTWVDLGDIEADPRFVAHGAQQRLGELDIVRKVVAGMPEECRQLWALLQEGYRYDEMSDRMGIAPGALRARVMRCRQKALAERERLRRNASRNPESDD